MEIIEIRDKLKAELAIVEKFFEIAKTHGANGSTTETKEPAPRDTADQGRLKLSGENTYGNIADSVREAIRMAPDKYTVRNLFTILESINKPLTKVQISTVLARLTKRGEVEVHKNGKGNKPTTYKKTNISTEKRLSGGEPGEG